MRLPYVPDPPTGLSKEDEQVVDRVRARRGPRGLIPLDLALLHAPKIADGRPQFGCPFSLVSQGYQD